MSNVLNVIKGVTGNPSDVVLTKEEVAARLKVTVRTVENWQHKGYLPFFKLDSMILFYWPDVIGHLQANFKVCPSGVRPR